MDLSKANLSGGDSNINSNEKFSKALYELLMKQANGNFVISPISIQIALSLALVGARNNTAKEIITALNLPEEREKYLQYVKELLLQLEKPTLKIATEMFIEKSYNVKNEYKEEAKKHLNSESQLVDFRTAFEASRNLINDWVLKKTNNKIIDLLPAGSVTPGTNLILVNAVHFKDKWSSQFEASATTDKPFYLTKEKSVNVPMMYRKDKYPYFENDKFQLLGLPYQDTSFRMMVLLPIEKDGLSSIEEYLGSMNLTELLDNMSKEEVMVHLPKFKLDYFSNLNSVLNQLGICEMFVENAADFSGIYEKGESALHVSAVVHKAFIDVNEEGTEAAAATGMIMVKCCAYISERRQFVFNADHPFLFLILHQESVLFIGRFTTPVNITSIPKWTNFRNFCFTELIERFNNNRSTRELLT